MNTQTHDYPDARKAQVSGWRRHWRHTTRRPVAYLSVHPVEGAQISGLIAHVPQSDWAALDLREAAYSRQKVPAMDIRHDHPEEIDVQIYRTNLGEDAAPSLLHPVLLSYLDTVAAGYFHNFGDEGLNGFFATTDGWNAPILDDRKTPIYPRAISASRDIVRRVEAALDTLEAPRISEIPLELKP